MASRRHDPPRPRKGRDGFWHARYAVWDPVASKVAGERKCQRRTQREVQVWIDREFGTPAPQLSGMRLARYVDNFRDEILYGLRSTQTVANYRGHLDLRIVPTLGRCSLVEVNPAVIERAQVTWHQGVSRTVVMGTRACLSRVCRLAIKQGAIVDNPVLRADKPPMESRKQILTLDWQEVDDLIDRMRRKDQLYADLVEVAVFTGVRVGELLALRRSDVNLDHRTIAIQRAWSGVGRDRQLGPPKSGRTRVVPLPTRLLPVLQRRVQQPGLETEMLWRGPMGGELRHANVLARSGFKQNVIAMGHPEFRWHDLRATAIVGWIRSGISLTVVRDWAGHSSLSTTDRYARVARNDHADALRMLDSYLTRTSVSHGEEVETQAS